MKKTSGKKIIFVVIKYAVVLLITISMVVPFIWMLSASFKTNLEVFEFPIRWIPETLMVPYQVVMIPQFSIIRQMGLTNTHLALIMIQAFTPMGVFLIKQFFDGIPDELIEAARIDGLSEFGIYSKMMLPLSKSAIVSLAILTITATWNDFLAPLIYISDKNLYTIQLGLRNLCSEYTTEYGQIMAASVMSVIPIFILYCFCQRFFEEGMVSGAVKG